MTLRLVADQKYPRPCIDVTIGYHTYAAFVNQSTDQTTINQDVLNRINSLRIHMDLPPIASPNLVEITIKRRDKQVTLEVETVETQKDPIVLGNDFMMGSGFSLSMDGIAINERSPVIDSPDTIDFIYNLEQGQSLRKWLEENERPMYNQYVFGQEPTLQQEPRVVVAYLPSETEEEAENETGTVSDADVLQLHAETEDLEDF